MSDWHLRKGLGQVAIGGIVWAWYLGSVWLLKGDYGIDSHTFWEIFFIPFSWVLNYALNIRWNFEVNHSWPRFARFCLISGFSWIPFLFASYAIADIFGAPLIVAHVFGIIAKTVSNITLQQLITFKDSNARSQA